LNLVTVDDVRIELMSDSTIQQKIKSITAMGNNILIKLDAGKITPMSGYKITIMNLQTPNKPVKEDFRSQIGIRLSNTD